MASCTVADIIADAQTYLGESDPANGEFTAAYLTPFFGAAYREMYNLMMKWQLPFVKRDVYFVLPADTNVIVPSQLGVTDFDEPEQLWERGSVTQVNITGVTNATPVVVTAPGASIASNQEITISGVVGPVGVNGLWFGTQSGNNVTLNGSVAGGAYVSGGVLAYSTDIFAPMRPVDVLPQINQALDTALLLWAWQNDRLYFTGANQARQLWIRYISSGAAPVSGDIGVDNCRDFLANRTAGLAAAARDLVPRAQELNTLALGTSMQSDGSGGMLRDAMIPKLLEKQLVPKRQGPFRPRRNNLTRSNLF